MLRLAQLTVAARVVDQLPGVRATSVVCDSGNVHWFWLGAMGFVDSLGKAARPSAGEFELSAQE